MPSSNLERNILNPAVRMLEQFNKFCGRRYVAARVVALGFKLGLYAFIQAQRLKPKRTNPRRFQINGHIIC